MPTSADDYHVLVAGAGPVGLTAAHELARRGLRVRLVDALPGPATTSRAIATHPRTLEIYDQMGLVAPILERGQRIHAFTIFKEGTRLARLAADYSTMPTRFPFSFIIEQTETEAVLRNELSRQGVKVEWGTRLAGLRQDGDAVRAELVHQDGTVEQARVPWLVGCDGGHSVVRKVLQLPLIGESSETWMIADAQVDTDLPRDSIYWVHSGGEALMLAPMREQGRWRMLDTIDVERDVPAAEAAARFSRKFSRGLGRRTTVSEPSWTSVFTFQQRMVPSMRVGRCFVAGDAAHVHSPASGQGMNTGIQEAYNLAWKLALVHHGHASQELLDTYSAERVPVGERLLKSTRTATFLVQLRNSLAGLMLPVVFGVVRNVPAVRVRMQRKILGGVSGLRLEYPGSPLTVPAPHGRGPRPGQRLTEAAAGRGAGGEALADELRELRWTLLVWGLSPQETELATRLDERHRAWLSVRTLTGRPDAGGPNPLHDPDGQVRDGLGERGWILARPDGYVCARGEPLSESRLRPAFAVIGQAVIGQDP
ncbi:FAD-dependent oxidoreductase [Nonomuraea sp. NPDC049158]|uniref:FAD-dependent oxidoreductase n=1 Tax=Nonomuraea sp. NPDC049158 TaxID=3155649 RepID=UPI0034038108